MQIFNSLCSAVLRGDLDEGYLLQVNNTLLADDDVRNEHYHANRLKDKDMLASIYYSEYYNLCRTRLTNGTKVA